jgi:hypothetical protein
LAVSNDTAFFIHSKTNVAMQLQQASRKRAKIKMAFQGPSGSGKTMSALLLAFGLCGDWSKIVVIDTENRSAELYSDLGRYNVVSIAEPYNPEKYIEAIRLCEKCSMEVIIIDSISHEWDGSGGILDVHGNMAGNSFTNWSKLTPRHNAFIQAIVNSPSHIIGTIRSKQDYVLQEKNGKMVPEKVGMKGVTRDGMDYEFTLVFEIDIKHNVSVSKDRTGLFTGIPEFKITINTGKIISDWCKSGAPEDNIGASIHEKINGCRSIKDLLDLYKTQIPKVQEEYSQEFSLRRKELMQPISSLPKSSSNGQYSNNPASE